MKHKRRKGQVPSGETRQRPPQIAASVDDRSAVASENPGTGAGSRTSARLARFGLAITGEPLLEPKPERI